MSSPLLLYDSLDVIGNGSFGIIRKVRRKADGLVCTPKVFAISLYPSSCSDICP